MIPRRGTSLNQTSKYETMRVAFWCGLLNIETSFKAMIGLGVCLWFLDSLILFAMYDVLASPKRRTEESGGISFLLKANYLPITFSLELSTVAHHLFFLACFF